MKNFSLPMMCKMKVLGCNIYFKMLRVLSQNCSNCSVEYIWIITPFTSMLFLSNTYVYNSLKGTHSHRGLDPWDFPCSCKAAAVLHPHAVLKPSTFSLGANTQHKHHTYDQPHRLRQRTVPLPTQMYTVFTFKLEWQMT